MDKESMIKELELRLIERAQFWDWYINFLVKMRDNGVRQADKSSGLKKSAAEAKLAKGLQQAIEAAMELQAGELAECLMLAGVGGERALQYAAERAKEVLGEEALRFAEKMGYVPTIWVISAQ